MRWWSWAVVGGVRGCVSILLVARSAHRCPPVTSTRAGVAAPSPQIASVTWSVLEGDASPPRILKFPVTLSEPSTSPVTVTYVIAGGTASSPGDFRDRGGIPLTVTFNVGGSGFTAVRGWIFGQVRPDTKTESDETLTVTLSAPTGGFTLGRSVGTGTILDDDPTGGLEVGVGDAAIVEGDTGNARRVLFPVTLSAAVGLDRDRRLHPRRGHRYLYLTRRFQ